MADLGKIGITYDENGYVATTPYEPLTVLKYTDGGTYMSILPTTGHLPTDATYWACMVPPTKASSIDYTPRAGGAITNTTVQGALEQADSLKFNKVNVVQTNINHAWKVPSSALLYATKNEINDSLTKFYPVISHAHIEAGEIVKLTKEQLATSAGIDVSRIVAIIPLLSAANNSISFATIAYNRYGSYDMVDITSTVAQDVYYVIYVVYK